MCFFTSESISVKSRFLSQLNMSFGSGGMTSALDNNHLTEYFQYLQRSHDGPIPIKKAVLIPGLQDDGTWVLNHETYISSDGQLLDPNVSEFVWLDRDLLYEYDKVRSADTTPPITLPLSAAPLSDLYTTVENISKHNFIPTLLVIGSCMAAFHFQTMVEAYSGCPIMVALGESETGKSTAIRAGLSLFGCDDISRYVKGSNAALLERACRSSIPFAIEEGKGSKTKSKPNSLDLAELIMSVSNGSRSTNLKSVVLLSQGLHQSSLPTLI